MLLTDGTTDSKNGGIKCAEARACFETRRRVSAASDRTSLLHCGLGICSGQIPFSDPYMTPSWRMSSTSNSQLGLRAMHTYHNPRTRFTAGPWQSISEALWILISNPLRA